MNIYEQCWSNAYESRADYRVPMDSFKQAIAFRAQCHRWRRKAAERIHGDDYDLHFLYDLTISIEDKHGVTVVFKRQSRIKLPPLPGVETGYFCLMDRPDGLKIERHNLPIEDSGFIQAYETQEQANMARAAEIALWVLPLKSPVEPKPALFPQTENKPIQGD